MYMIFIDKAADGNKIINLTIGDDAVLEIPLKTDDGEDYEMGENEYLIFTVREKANEDSPVMFELESERGSNEITIAHDDTKDFNPGYYSAEVQFMGEDGKRITVWPKLTGNGKTSQGNRKNLCLMSEVVYK